MVDDTTFLHSNMRSALQDAIKQWGHRIPAEEVTAIMTAADVDGDGVIDYHEFVAATINVNQLEKEELIYKAFQEFDVDCSNSISLDELEKVGLALYTRCVMPESKRPLHQKRSMAGTTNLSPGAHAYRGQAL